MARRRKRHHAVRRRSATSAAPRGTPPFSLARMRRGQEGVEAGRQSGEEWRGCPGIAAALSNGPGHWEQRTMGSNGPLLCAFILFVAPFAASTIAAPARSIVGGAIGFEWAAQPSRSIESCLPAWWQACQGVQGGKDQGSGNESATRATTGRSGRSHRALPDHRCLAIAQGWKQEVCFFFFFYCGGSFFDPQIENQVPFTPPPFF